MKGVYKNFHAGKGLSCSDPPSFLLDYFEMSSNYLTRTVPNHRVEELRNQGPRIENVLPALTYIKNRVDELKWDTDQLKDSHREMASAVIRLDDSCFEEFGRIDQRLYRIEESVQNLIGIAEKQAQSAQEIRDLMEEMLDRTRESGDICRPTVHWALDPPNGEEPQGRGGSSDGSEKQFVTNEDF